MIRRQGYVVRDTKFRISEFSSVSTLEFAWENIPRKSDLVHRVAGSGQVTLLRWLIEEKKATFDERATFHAATYKRYDALKFLVENGAPMTKDVSHVCSSNGAEDCLCFALDNGAESDFICSSNAAENGHLKILKFLHEEKGVPINADTAYSAAKNGHTGCLKYLIEDKLSRKRMGVHLGRETGSFGVFALFARTRCAMGRIHVPLCLWKWSRGVSEIRV